MCVSDVATRDRRPADHKTPRGISIRRCRSDAEADSFLHARTEAVASAHETFDMSSATRQRQPRINNQRWMYRGKRRFPTQAGPSRCSTYEDHADVSPLGRERQKTSAPIANYTPSSNLDVPEASRLLPAGRNAAQVLRGRLSSRCLGSSLHAGIGRGGGLKRDMWGSPKSKGKLLLLLQ